MELQLSQRNETIWLIKRITQPGRFLLKVVEESGEYISFSLGLEIENQKVMFDMDKKEFMNYFNILSNFKAFIEGQPSHFKIQQKVGSPSPFSSVPPVSTPSSLTPLPSKPVTPESFIPNLKEPLHIGNIKLTPIPPKVPKTLPPMSLDGKDLPEDTVSTKSERDTTEPPQLDVDKSLESLHELDNAEQKFQPKVDDSHVSTSHTESGKTIKLAPEKKPLKESDWDPW